MSSELVRDKRHDFCWQPRALLIAADEAHGRAAAEMAVAAGARLVANVSIDDAPTWLAAQGPLDLLVIETMGAPTPAVASVVDAAAGFAETSDATIVMAVDMSHIDLAGGALIGGRHQLLCAPSAGERFAAIACGLARDRSVMLNEASRESEAARLQRLNEEVARIAETLARLTRNEHRPAPAAGAVFDRTAGYRAEPGAPLPVTPAVTAAELRQLIRARRLRDQHLGGGMFEDPAWDMLLDLFAAHLERGQVSVSSLCIAAAVAPTTALRWIGRMTDAGLLERRPDPFDRRRAFMGLSPKALDGMGGYFAALKRAGLGPVV